MKHTNFYDEIDVSESDNERVWIWSTAIFGVLFIGFLVVRSLV